MSKSHLSLLFIGALFLGYRIAACLFGDMPVNSAPIAALFFCGVLVAGKSGAIITSLLWLATYPLLSLLQGYPIGMDFLASLFGFGLIVLLAFQVQRPAGQTQSAALLIGGSLLSALGFYFITNTFSWLGMPLYSKNLEGFVQAQWAGHPSFLQPTWVFLRNSLIGNGALAVLLVVSLWKLNFGMKSAPISATHQNLLS